MVVILGVVIFIVACVAGVYYLRDGVNKSWMEVMHQQYDKLAGEYRELMDKHERVQHGYDQGVLEGTRQGYVNVRAFLIANIEAESPANRAFLVTWLHPRLDKLGEKEHALLLDMKGLADSEKAFQDANLPPTPRVLDKGNGPFIEPERTIGFAQSGCDYAETGPENLVTKEEFDKACRGNGNCTC